MLDFILIAITVLTWNTGRMGQYAKPEKNEVLQYLVRQDADVICLQEVDVYKDAQFLTLPDVKAALGKKYPYSYLDFAIYDKRHQYGTMVWSKYPIIHKQSIHYKTIGNISNRCDIVVAKDTIRLINNHLESYNFIAEDLNDMDKLKAKWLRALPLRNEQARVVRKEIDESPYPVIVVGDFNSIELSYAYWHISRGLHDAWRSTHLLEWGGTCEHRGWTFRIDYILSTETLVPTACEVVETPGSDHKPVVATLEW
ncbi:MAG: endonuclease/exonuclease/phosphatase family protein [Paludibacteraceae bacterium]|nr:endonuclease/exonuclease/phosphatase family protein [Paludibacteraceae bacterium]